MSFTKVGALPLLQIAVDGPPRAEPAAAHPLLSAETRARSKAERAAYSARLRKAIANVQAGLRQVHVADAEALLRWWLCECTMRPLLWRATDREMRLALRQLISERCPEAMLLPDPGAAQTPEGAGILVVFKPAGIQAQLKAFGVRDLRSGVVAQHDRFELKVYGEQSEHLQLEHHTPKQRGALVQAFAVGKFGPHWVERRVTIEHLELARTESPVSYHAGWQQQALALIESQALRTLLRAAEQYLHNMAPTGEQAAAITLPGTDRDFSGWGGVPLPEVPTGILKGVHRWLLTDRARVLTYPRLAGGVQLVLAARHRKRPVAPTTASAPTAPSASESL